jgi:TctA family transporter
MIALLFGLILAAIWLGVALFFIIAAWKVFTKAGQPGWGIFIPFYNVYLWIKIAGKPGWWLVLYCIPLVNIVVSIMVTLVVGKAFGKSTAFSVFLLIIFGFIGIPILGYGSAVYTSPTATPTPAPAPTPVA